MARLVATVAVISPRNGDVHCDDRVRPATASSAFASAALQLSDVTGHYIAENRQV